MRTHPRADGPLRLIKFMHERLAFRRRVRVLSAVLADLVPVGASVLDMGCGDGTIGYLIGRLNPTASIQGLEVTPRPSCLIECESFDGASIPRSDDSVDVCMFVDVLHHTLNIEELLKEARRVARRHVLVKDHLYESRFDRVLLRFMDWVGNQPHGVQSVYNYKRRAEWDRVFSSCGLRVVSWNQCLPLYPPPFNRIFVRGLHYVGLLEKT